jgi:hypothetical protein
LKKLWGYASDRARHVREGQAVETAEAELVVSAAHLDPCGSSYDGPGKQLRALSGGIDAVMIADQRGQR